MMLGAITPLVVATSMPLVLQEDAKKPVEFREVDYSKLERKIVQEPEYVSKPRYALFLFGPEGAAQMWAVLDKSKAELPYYDVLYCDKDFDGDLTAANERFVSNYDEDRARAGIGIDLKPGDIRVPGTNLVHTGFRVATVSKGSGGKSDGSAWFQMRWNGQHEISGGYAPARKRTTVWGESPASAPVIRPTPLGPFSFALYTWGADGWKLPVGGSSEVYVMVGNRGSGPDTLAVVDEHFLDLTRDELIVTVLAHDSDGKPVHTRARLEEHC